MLLKGSETNTQAPKCLDYRGRVQINVGLFCRSSKLCIEERCLYYIGFYIEKLNFSYVMTKATDMKYEWQVFISEFFFHTISK